MNFDIVTISEAAAGAITAISGLYAAARHLRYNIQAKKDKERQAILAIAEEQINKIAFEFEEKIKNIKNDLENHKVNVSKDFGFLKETYSSEVKNLGEKIEIIRDQLSQQHGQLVALLTRMIDK